MSQFRFHFILHIKGQSLDQRLLFYQNKKINEKNKFPIMYTVGYWLNMPLTTSTALKVTCVSNLGNQFAIKVFLAISCQQPFLRDGNLVGICDPYREMGLIVNINDRMEVIDATREKPRYPEWLPMTNVDVDYVQMVCKTLCEGLTMFWRQYKDVNVSVHSLFVFIERERT